MSVETIGSEPTKPTEKCPNLASFNVAVSQSFKKKDSTECTETTTWYKCNSWSENRSNFLMSAIQKGDKVVVIGRPSVTAYIAKDGKPAASMEISIEQIVLMKKKEANNQTQMSANSAKYSKQSQHASLYDDGLPF